MMWNVFEILADMKRHWQAKFPAFCVFSALSHKDLWARRRGPNWYKDDVLTV